VRAKKGSYGDKLDHLGMIETFTREKVGAKLFFFECKEDKENLSKNL